MNSDICSIKNAVKTDHQPNQPNFPCKFPVKLGNSVKTRSLMTAPTTSRSAGEQTFPVSLDISLQFPSVSGM
jgi:hypothetical protein